MAYIIEHANLIKGQARSVTNLLVEEGMILAAGLAFSKHEYMRMDAGPYLMTPTHVLFDSNLPLNQPFHDRKEYYSNHFIKKGSTAVLTNVKIHFAAELESSLKRARSSLSDSPVDYIIGVKFRPALLRPELIRKLKREKVPALFVEIKTADELYELPWGWIKEALFPYNCPLIPVFLDCENKKSRQQKANMWRGLMEKAKVPSIDEELPERSPLSRKALMKTGIFPLKANLHNGGELSYNLYRKPPSSEGATEWELFHDHPDALMVSVHKGKVIRAGDNVYYRPGQGENAIIKTPGFFTDPD